MQKMLDELETIKSLLEQVDAITENQMTVLLEPNNAVEAITILEEMANYKEEITTQIESAEDRFQQAYALCKGNISLRQAGVLQQAVGEVLVLRERIMVNEEKNLTLMEAKVKKEIAQSAPVKIQKQQVEVAKAYQQFGKKEIKE